MYNYQCDAYSQYNYHFCFTITKGKIWDPVTGSEQYWINIRKVLSKYGHQRRCIFM